MTHHAPAPAPLLVNSRDAARLLAISPRTLFALVKSGQVPVVRVGRRVLFSVEALQRWVRARLDRGEP